jgi:hypothetical protein
MIHVTPAPEPGSFQKIRKKGLRAIRELAGETPTRKKPLKPIATERHLIPPDKFPTYWTEALDDLMEAYDLVCAYSCFRIHPVTGAGSVDHMVAKSKAWNRVYEWDNYRLACSRLNARKNDFCDVLDPFEVQDDWFHLELVGFQVLPNEALDGDRRAKIQDTIDRLALNDFRRYREDDAEAYWNRDVSLKRLEKESPFVARELRRQGRLNPGDE